jgi:hypothetical protein
MSFLDVTQRLNLRPLIMSKAQIDAIIADPNFHEIAFYVTLHKVGTRELGIRTLRYALINSVGKIYNFDGKPVSSPPLFTVSRFLNSGVMFLGGFNSGVKIKRNPLPEKYLLNILQTSLNASVIIDQFVMFHLEDAAPGFYEVIASLSSRIGGGGGAEVPGSVNNTPPPLTS